MSPALPSTSSRSYPVSAWSLRNACSGAENQHGANLCSGPAQTHRDTFQVHPVPLHVHCFHDVHLPTTLGTLGLVKVLLRGFANHEPDLVSRADVPSSNPVLGLHKGLGRVRESGWPSDGAHGSTNNSRGSVADSLRKSTGRWVDVRLHSPALEFRGVQNLEVVQSYMRSAGRGRNTAAWTGSSPFGMVVMLLEAMLTMAVASDCLRASRFATR